MFVTQYTIVSIAKYDNGAHDNQTTEYPYCVPDGWAYLPSDIATPLTENYPFGDITTKTIRKDSPEYDWVDRGLFGENEELEIVDSWTPLPIPPAQPAPSVPPEDDTTIQDIEDVLCNMEMTIDERLSAIEEALCELDPENNK